MAIDFIEGVVQTLKEMDVSWVKDKQENVIEINQSETMVRTNFSQTNSLFYKQFSDWSDC
jgi:uncharacterized protein YacL (UPF0231 family)